jgi:hypothetical protein
MRTKYYAIAPAVLVAALTSCESTNQAPNAPNPPRSAQPRHTSHETTPSTTPSTRLTDLDGNPLPDESHGGLTLDQQRAEEDALATTDWSVTSTSTANSAGYQVTVTIAQDLKKPVASPVLTIASVGGIQPTEFPTECTVDNDGAFCALAVTTRTVYPITLTFQYPANATQLNLNVDPRGDTELTPANNTTTLNLTSSRPPHTIASDTGATA